ncbi:MAG TPA: response regulator transcription factor [Solirubrobacteraceae bacterium]|jgi:DNA-binding NarL/FixJ family response regulator
MTDTPIRILLAESHTAARRNLSALLTAEHGFSVIAEACDPASALRELDERKPDVLVLDLALTAGECSRAVRLLAERSPATAIVALSTRTEPGFASAVTQAGASACLLKEMAEELPAAIRAAVAEARRERAQRPGHPRRLSLIRR